MAQWEQRDPRWLVKELGTTGSNVNGWHWEEKSKLGWCKQRLQELTNGLQAELDPSIGSAKLSGLHDLTGEAYLAKRKGNKTLVTYDLCITLSWLGKLATEENEVEGTVKISEFALGNDQEDYTVLIVPDKEDEKYKCLTEAVKTMWPTLLKLLAQFDSELQALQQ